MKSRLVAGAVLAGSLLIGQGRALAEDIDLFVQPAGAVVGIPNVLLVLDNTANWGRTVDGQAIWINELNALLTTLTNLPVNDDGTAVVRVGVLMFNETGSPNNNIGGGYIRAAIRNMTDANKTKYMAMLSSFNVTTDRSNNGKAGLAMAEAWRYFKGEAPYAGNSKVKTDYLGNTTASNTVATKAVHALPGNAINSFAGSPYNSPVAVGDCGRNYIVYISNGAAQDNNSDITTGTNMLVAAAASENINGAALPIPISPSGSQVNMADEWARFMRRSTLGVITYTVDVDKIATGQGPGWSALLRSIAGVSNGRYFDVTSGNGGADLTDALGRIFSEIQAVNSVFSSVSLPVSITTQGTFLNQVYIGQFRPDALALPRWPGNLKQYKLGIVNNQLRTLDADDFSAINPGTGFLTECARSFWTPSVVDNYWAFSPSGDCIAVPNSDVSNFPDGNIVEKGGHAYRLRAAASRTMKTCNPAFASCTTLTDFETANGSITQALLGAADSTERDLLIDWQRGLDVGTVDQTNFLSELLNIAVMRLIFPDLLIPASLDVDGLNGLEDRLNAGANVVTSIIPPDDGYAGVANASNDISEGYRTVAGIQETLTKCGLKNATVDEYKNWVENQKSKIDREVGFANDEDSDYWRKIAGDRNRLSGKESRVFLNSTG
jgi:type IV pilus assembly protein PilY1